MRRVCGLSIAEQCKPKSRRHELGDGRAIGDVFESLDKKPWALHP